MSQAGYRQGPTAPPSAPPRPSSPNYNTPPPQRSMNSGVYNGASGPQQAGPFTPAPMPVSGIRPGVRSAANLTMMKRDDVPGQRRGMDSRTLLGIVVMLVILVGGSIYGLVYITSHGSANNAKPTPVAIPTPRVPATFGDAFNDNSYGWNLDSVQGKYQVQIGNGNLSLEDDDHKLLWEPIPGERSFSDFKLFVDASLAKGDNANGYGVYIRATSNQDSSVATYYRFALFGDGSYAIFKGVLDPSGRSGYTKLVDDTLNPAIKKGKGVNHIIITAQGSSLSLTVNGQLLKTVTDTSYASGSAGLFVSNIVGTKAGAQVQFSNFGVYPLNA